MKNINLGGGGFFSSPIAFLDEINKYNFPQIITLKRD